MSLGICLQGHAGVQIMDASCPMWHAHAEAAQHHIDHAPAHADEHEHAHDGQQHGSPCASDEGTTHCSGHLGCQSASVGVVPTLFHPASRSIVQQAVIGVAPAFRSYTAYLLWRPPALA